MLKPIVIEQGDDESYVFPPIPDDVDKAVRLLQRIRLKPKPGGPHEEGRNPVVIIGDFNKREMTPATNTTPRIARPQTREQQVVQLLTERHGEKLTASAVAVALNASYVENVRATLKLLAARRMIAVDYERRLYKVGNAVCRHKAAL